MVGAMARYGVKVIGTGQTFYVIAYLPDEGQFRRGPMSEDEAVEYARDLTRHLKSVAATPFDMHEIAQGQSTAAVEQLEPIIESSPLKRSEFRRALITFTLAIGMLVYVLSLLKW